MKISPQIAEYAKILLEKDMAIDEVQNALEKKYKVSVSQYHIKKLQKEISEEIDDDEMEKVYQENKDKVKLRKEKQFLDKKHDRLLKELEVKEKALDLLEVAQRDDWYYTIKKPKLNKWKSESTSVICASDWHIEEVVDPDVVGGMNEFNLKIAEKRSENFFKNSLKLIEWMEYDTTIKDIVLWLWGDFISWYIHEELVEGNEVSPTEAILLVKRMLEAGINYYLDNSDKKLTLITSYGNHGRTTPKSRVSTGYKNNFEWLMYNIIADKFADNKRVKSKISKWYFNILDVYDKKIRFHHWDNLKYNGGVGGLYIPTNKAIAQWNKWMPVDLDVFWHYHQLIDWGNFIANGSLIWYWPYAQSIKASPERPQQAMFLINEKFWKTITAPIIVTE